MSYSDFSIKQICKEFQVSVREEMGLFTGIGEIPVSDSLSEILAENVPLAISINTEKARSELVIANILLEIRKIFKPKISFFSGTEFTVDKEKGLTGFCDFIISQSPEQLYINAPVVTIVEAKNENIMAGMGQCISEMLAAQIFNQREKNEIKKVYGSVTSGTIWKFIRLEGEKVCIDLKDYTIENPGKILGILAAMIRQEA
ncbi:MAG: hypothetical protein R2941_11290 [Desulfobacterales bacterium]